MRASREDEAAAQASGVNVVLHRLIAFVISAFLSGIAGVLLAHFLGIVRVENFYLDLKMCIRDRGLTPPLAGSIRFSGTEIRGLPAYRIAKLGLGLVPEGRQVFPNLTARENLLATAANRNGAADPWTIEKIFSLFPRLAARAAAMANLLSGGEQQMLAVGRALMTNPRLLILDEATEGLAPMIRDEIWRCLKLLRGAGQSILVIDKNVDALTRIADRHYICLLYTSRCV